MKFSFDLRFAHLPCGSWPYVSNVIWQMVRDHPDTQWRIYHNPQSSPQQQIVRRLKEISPPDKEPARVEYQPVRNLCLSLRHHLEFLSYHDDADVYHYPHFDLPLGMRKIPLVMTIHDLYPLTLPGYCSAPKRAYFKYIAGKNARRAARVITVSQNTKRDVIEHLAIPEEKIIVINQGYSEKFHPIGDEQMLETVRQKYRLPKTFILYTGNHKPHKNLDRLIRPYAQLPQDLRDTYPLVLTGPISEDTQSLLTIAQTLNLTAAAGYENMDPTESPTALNFLGLIDADDLPVLYNLASLTVMPSLYEGFGLAPLESMVCGTPAVCSNTSAIPEVAGDAARMFDPYDIDQIAHTIQKALENDLDNPAVRQKGFENAKKFSWSKNARLTYQVYQEAAKK